MEVQTMRTVQGRDMARLISKLRWLGLDEEANRLRQSMRDLPPEQRRTIYFEPVNTD
jgi:hypothetical protein